MKFYLQDSIVQEPVNKLRLDLIDSIKAITDLTFEAVALDVFRYQAAHNPLYAQYLQLLGIHPNRVNTWSEIPHLPIQFFKNFTIQTADWLPEVIYTSSGTTAQTTSQHFVRDEHFYLQNAQRGFEYFYGDVKNYCILALLPSYLERSDSSLVAMAAAFIQQSRYTESGFFSKKKKR